MGAALVLAGSLILSGCGNTENAEVKTTDIVVDMQQADTGNLTLQNSFIGMISPQELVYVIPFASGTVTEVNYGVGDYVNAGDVLFKIDDAGARLQLEQAQLSAASARQQVDMATGSQQKSTDLQLEGSEVQARSAYEQAQIGYYQVRNKYDELEDAVDKTEEGIESLKSGIESLNTGIKELDKVIAAGSSVSGGNGAAQAEAQKQQMQQQLAGLREQLVTAQSTLSTLETQKDTLHDSLLQAESGYRAAEAALNIAQDSKNLAQGEIRNDTNAQTKTSLELAQLGIDSAELALSYYTVTAPISGIIQSRGVEVNGIAGGSSPAFSIANENTMTVTFQVSEAVKNTLKTGDTITVERNGENYEGNITEVGVAVNQQTGLFQVKAAVNADGEEMPNGVSVKVTADTYSVANEILIPYDSIYYDNNGAYVYLCVDGKAAKTYVTTGIFDDTTIVITEGISKGDTVITSWSPKLLDGAPVTASGTIQK